MNWEGKLTQASRNSWSEISWELRLKYFLRKSEYIRICSFVWVFKVRFWEKWHWKWWIWRISVVSQWWGLLLIVRSCSILGKGFPFEVVLVYQREWNQVDVNDYSFGEVFEEGGKNMSDRNVNIGWVDVFTKNFSRVKRRGKRDGKCFYQTKNGKKRVSIKECVSM